MWCSIRKWYHLQGLMTLCIHLYNNKAYFTLRVRAKKLGAKFEHFWVTNWPQVINKC